MNFHYVFIKFSRHDANICINYFDFNQDEVERFGINFTWDDTFNKKPNLVKNDETSIITFSYSHSEMH